MKDIGTIIALAISAAALATSIYSVRLARKATRGWRLEGYSHHQERFYPIKGIFEYEAQAQEAAHEQLAHFEKTQPSDVSGGQHGHQDQVHIVRPDGTKYRFHTAGPQILVF